MIPLTLIHTEPRSHKTKLNIAFCESTQSRVDSLMLNAIKSLIMTNTLIYDLEFVFFGPNYIDFSKIEELLKNCSIPYTLLNETDMSDIYNFTKTMVNYGGPYNKFVLYEYMKKYDWYLYLDDDIIVKQALPRDIIEDFLRSGKAVGLASDYQTKDTAPVLYTDKYNIKDQYNTGVVLVNNKYIPDDLLIKFKEINDEYYTNNPDMTRDMAEQTPFNIMFKNSIYEMSNAMNFKPMSITRAPAEPYNTAIIHWAGYNKDELVANPLDVDYGWLYDAVNKFKILNKTDEFV